MQVRPESALGDGILGAQVLPEENRGPAPAKMTTRTTSFASALRNASPSSIRSPRFCAFRESIRLRVIRTILPSSSVS
jgi:hypothetical protein